MYFARSWLYVSRYSFSNRHLVLQLLSKIHHLNHNRFVHASIYNCHTSQRLEVKINKSQNQVKVKIPKQSHSLKLVECPKHLKYINAKIKHFILPLWTTITVFQVDLKLRPYLKLCQAVSHDLFNEFGGKLRAYTHVEDSRTSKI